MSFLGNKCARRALWGLVLCLAGTACRSAPTTSTPEPRYTHVKAGATDGDGSKARPFGRIDEALAAGALRLQLAPGVHPAPAHALARSTVLVGAAGGATQEGPATSRIRGRLRVSGATLTAERLCFESGLELRAARATVRGSTLAAAGEDDALNAFRTRVELESVLIRPGLREGVYVLGSTLSMSRSRAEGPTRRSLSTEASRVRLEDVELGGATEAHWQAQRSTAEVRDLRTSTSARAGTVLGGTTARITGGRLAGRRHALLGVGSRIAVEGARIVGGNVFAVGANTSTLSLRRVSIDAAGGGVALAVGGQASIRSSTIAFARQDGLTATGVELELEDVRVRGGAMSRDGLVVHGETTRARLHRVVVEGTAGWAVVATGEAALEVDSSTIGPGGGGVWIQNGWRGRTRMHGSRVHGCVDEAGLRFDAAWVRTEGLVVEGCRVVGSRHGELEARRARLEGGLRLLGGSLATVGGRIAGKPWAVFCGPGGQLQGDAVATGTVAGCWRPPTGSPDESAGP